MTWREIEEALVAYAKQEGFEVLVANESGDFMINSDEFPINLTDLAKFIEDRVKG